MNWKFNLSSLVLTVAFIICESVIEYRTKIALATQGKASEMPVWKEVYSSMKHRHRVVLFLLSYDSPIDSAICNDATVICSYAPDTTWASGRNVLTRSIAVFADKKKVHFKYWLFSDQDMVWLKSCGASECQISSNLRGKGLSPWTMNLTSCCFDAAMESLLAREVQYAVVNFVIWDKSRHSVSWPSFAHWDCCDGALNAIHHAAVPVLLPYVELVEKLTWWESQGAQHSVIVGCLGGYSVYSNIISIRHDTTNHKNYPRGRFPLDLAKALQHVYGTRGLMPQPIQGLVDADQGNCAGHDYEKMGLQGAFEQRVSSKPGKAPLKTIWNSSAWFDSVNFKQCLSALQSRYLTFLSTGNVTALDGEQYTVRIPVEETKN